MNNISVVWVYASQFAAANEIELSINYAKKNFPAKNYLICGDAVPGVDHILTPDPAKGVYGKWIDSIIKLRNIIDDSRVADDFLWLYDDTFILEPTDIPSPAYWGKLETTRPTSTWGSVKNLTIQLLPPNPKNFSTHYPMIYNKEKLTRILDDIGSKPMLIESVYGNLCGNTPIPVPDWFKYIRTPLPGNYPVQGAKMVNLGHFNHYAQRIHKEGSIGSL